MSGGSWGYAYIQMDDFADRLESEDADESKWTEERMKENPGQREARRALAKVVREVAKAMHAIEWVDSGDCCYPDDVNAIDGVRAYLARFTESVDAAQQKTEPVSR